MNQFKDREVTCLDCGCSFPFSAEDQEFFAKKGYSEPKRCSSCRETRKANSSRGGGRQGGSRGGYDGSRPQFNVTCSQCGCQTTVPFEPKADRPVYCSDCYRG